MFRDLLNRILSLQPLRRWTDVPITCEMCGGDLGYVCRSGHRRWKHRECRNAIDRAGRIGPKVYDSTPVPVGASVVPSAGCDPLGS